MLNNRESFLRHRTEAFGGDVLDYAGKFWPRGSHIQQQLSRSATSVGANYLEACNARSRAEFISKTHISLQEAEESRYWIRISLRQKLGPADEGRRLETERHEIVKMLMASIHTARSNQQKH